MAIFQSGGSNQHSKRRTEPVSLSIVGADLEIMGHLETRGVVKVEGRVTGNITAMEQVLVATGATVEGDIVTREAVIGGVVHGGIEAAERVELLDTAVVTGNIVTARLLIHEGGLINGEVMMRQPGGSQEDVPVVARTVTAESVSGAARTVAP